MVSLTVHIAYVNDLISYTKEYLTDTAANNSP